MLKKPPEKDIHQDLLDYHHQLVVRLDKKSELEPLQSIKRKILQKHDGRLLPDFCRHHSEDISKKKILAVLQDPGNSGAVDSRMCLIWNDDSTAENQRSVVIKKLEMNLDEIFFWNFYPYFGWKVVNKAITPKQRVCQKMMCAEELRKLAKLMKKNLRVIVVCGNEAWEGMKFFKPSQRVSMLWVPHPSKLGMMTRKSLSEEEKCKLLEKGWKTAKEIING